MIDFGQELSKFELGLDKEEVMKMVVSEGEEATSIQQSKVDQIMKRYGLAVNYCKTDSYDLAYIQIQKVARLLPNHALVQQLLALICIHEGKEEAALQALDRVASLDAGNSDIARYKEAMTVKEEPAAVAEEPQVEENEPDSDTKESKRRAIKVPKKKTKNKKAENDTASSDTKKKTQTKKMVANGSDFEEVTSNRKSFIYLGLGFLIGVIAMMILVVPTARSSVKSQYANEAESYEDQLKAKDTEISSLKDELEAAEKETEDAKAEVKAYKNGSQDLYEAADEYISGNTVDAAEKLLEIDTDILTSDASKNLYDAIKDKTFSTAASSFYRNGLNQWYKKNYSEAESYFKKAIKCDDSNASYYYYLARAYEADGKTDKAIKNYDKVVDLGSSYVTDSKSRIEKLEAQQSSEEEESSSATTTEESE